MGFMIFKEKKLKEKLKKTSVYIDEKDYEIFKKVAKINKSNSGKVIRNFIKKYLYENIDTVAELKKKGEI